MFLKRDEKALQDKLELLLVLNQDVLCRMQESSNQGDTAQSQHHQDVPDSPVEHLRNILLMQRLIKEELINCHVSLGTYSCCFCCVLLFVACTCNMRSSTCVLFYCSLMTNLMT